MDRRGRERLIGAAVLVALAVAVVPELLSGPKAPAPAQNPPQFGSGAPDPVRNVTVDLNTSKQTAPAATPSQPLPPPPAPAASQSSSPPAKNEGAGPSMAAPPAPAAPVVGAVAAVPVPPLEPAPAPPTSQAGFAVQLGSFANRGNADALLHQLKSQGYAVYESTEGHGKAARYRVRVGPFSEREAAERSMAKLKAQGHASSLIAPR